MIPLSRVRLSGLYGCSVKNQIFGPFFGPKRAPTAPRRPLCNSVNTIRLSFRCPVMMVTILFEAVYKKMISGQNTAFLGPKRATLGNRCRKTTRRTAKRPPTGKPKLSRVTSGYGGLMIPLSRVRLMIVMSTFDFLIQLYLLLKR